MNMETVWIIFSIILLVVLSYGKLKKLLFSYLDKEILKINQKFNEIEDVKEEIEKVYKISLEKADRLAKEKRDLWLSFEEECTEILNEKDNKVKIILEREKINLRNEISLIRKRKIDEIRRDIYKEAGKIIEHRLSKKSIKIDYIPLIEKSLDSI